MWSSQAEIDQVTRAQGEVIPSQRTQVVQPLESGALLDLYVASGDVVSAGIKWGWREDKSAAKTKTLRRMARALKPAKLMGTWFVEPFRASGQRAAGC
ncbi:hypothetical protein [Yoonia sp.]|uniref:hypothetical protein n=1 Tax=Yoonia sp. TaxID=2212373 RepID=UPI0039756A48